MVALAPDHPAHGVGLLTSLPRDLWAQHYPALYMAGTNTLALRTIETALFTLSLDPAVSDLAAHDASSRWAEGDHPRSALVSLHGGGTAHAGANRWHDKCIQVAPTLPPPCSCTWPSPGSAG